MFLQDKARGDRPQSTYVPPTYADVPSLWRRWLEEDSKLSVSPNTSPSRHASRYVKQTSSDAPPKQSLKEMLALQATRAQEAEVYDEIQAHNQRRHITLLDRTPDICHGRLDSVINSVRTMTAGRE
ncbi:Hypothetical protein, putative [Bodo saltans]|uniref:Uncharacterized protein n=1 Tax=Bodo saltans TaxID=75058 RepID=A0A0S4J9W3_BODSA|nr:Hypothetical protein, putative [Bodo saltans]|eukprot:CUG88244.1 Hypothetical protein, putative [Bodo saltans]